VLFASELAEDAGWDRLESGGAMFKRLRGDLAAALVPVVEGTTLPAKERVQAGLYLCEVGDPRPGVCTLPLAMVPIEGGTFTMGDEDEAHQVTVATFELARYLLTNAQWQLFIDGEGYDPDQKWWDEAGRAWLRKNGHTQLLRWHHERFGKARPNHPAVGMSWYEAVAFCDWLSRQTGDNYYLPSEAEWEYAARGPAGRIFPWGNKAPDAERANYDSIYDGPSTVGCFPAGATPEDGIYDLTGNVWEWTRSAYRDHPYDADDRREDMDNPAKKAFILRGGGWGDLSKYLRASYRLNFAPIFRSYYFGCRVARRLP
jgi:formylglycine-generating enzyme required for sulfatase activity